MKRINRSQWVRESDLEALKDYTREFEIAVRTEDGDRAATAARTIEAVITPVLNELDHEGMVSPAIIESNGRYIGPRKESRR